MISAKPNGRQTNFSRSTLKPSSAWTANGGGDRPDALDLHCCRAGEPIHLHVVLNAASLPGGQGAMAWRMLDRQGQIVVECSDPLPSGALRAGRPVQAGVIHRTAPLSGQPQQLRLEVVLQIGDWQVQNHWPLWVYPPHSGWADKPALYDPSGHLKFLQKGALRFDRFTHLPGAPLRAVLVAAGAAGALVSSIIHRPISYKFTKYLCEKFFFFPFRLGVALWSGRL